MGLFLLTETEEILGSLKKKTVFDGKILSCELEKVLAIFAEKSGGAKQYLNRV